MTEPRTDAGRRLLDGFAPMPLPDAPELHRRSAMGRRVKVHAAIVAIEAEAEGLTAARLDAAIREYVNKVDYIDIGDSLDFEYVPKVAAGLAAILARLSDTGDTQ